MDLLNRLIKESVSVNIEFNEHKLNYQTIEQFFEWNFFYNSALENSNTSLKEIIEYDNLVLIQRYPDTPVWFYTAVHYDLQLLLEEIYLDIEKWNLC